MLVTTVIIVDPHLSTKMPTPLVHEMASLVEKGAVLHRVVHENAGLVEKGAVWTPLVHENASLVENSGNYVAYITKKKH